MTDQSLRTAHELWERARATPMGDLVAMERTADAGMRRRLRRVREARLKGRFTFERYLKIMVR